MGLFDRFKRSSKSAVDPKEKDNESEKVSDGEVDAQVPVLGLSDTAGVGALDVMADHIYRDCLTRGWLELPPVHTDHWSDEIITGVSIRSKYGAIRSCPFEHRGFQTFEESVIQLNPRVAIKMTCKAVEVAMRTHVDGNPGLFELYVNADTRIQVLDTIESLAFARKNQYAALIRDEGVLVVWADRVEQIIPFASKLETALIAYLWADEKDPHSQDAPTAPTTPGLGSSPFSRSTLSFVNANQSVMSLTPAVVDLTSSGENLDGIPETAEGAVEEDPVVTAVKASRKGRPVAFHGAFIAGCASAGAMLLMGLGVRQLLISYVYTGDAARFALIAILPFITLLVAFPCSVVISSILHFVGPISQFNKNSAYYSAQPPPRDAQLAPVPITIQMPVYKESLEGVIIPTIESLKVAVTTYERQGGTVNIIVCDDGLQLATEEDRARRIKYYSDNNLAYVSRPPHGKDGYLRRGRFKKAGNLNHCNIFSLEIERVLEERRAEAMTAIDKTVDTWSELDERMLYEQILHEQLEKREGKTWANGNIRIGEIILMIDSDTRVPEDCLLDASLEMSLAPQVAVIQHASGVMQVANHFFENGMAFFTSILQIGISMTVANGDVAPFVGHNAFLRWSALQECAHIDPFDGIARVWSESHVSEDFQVALTLQCKGWQLRWATYSKQGFQEGVSLTCGDELSRWQKYSYGCSEIIFNPMRYWFTRGPFTKLFRQFLVSPMPTHTKWGVLAYMSSYYAFALAWSGTLLNFVLIGVFAWNDQFYVTSWNILFVCLILFAGLNNLAFCVLRYRLKLHGAGAAAWAQFKWIPFFCVFFSGLSLSVCWALLCHLLSINISWTSTSKTVEVSNFFRQIPSIWKRFWFQLIFSTLMLAGMIISTTSLVPIAYRVSSIPAIIPMCFTYGGHLLWPFALDPFFTT